MVGNDPNERSDCLKVCQENPVNRKAKRCVNQTKNMEKDPNTMAADDYNLFEMMKIYWTTTNDMNSDRRCLK